GTDHTEIMVRPDAAAVLPRLVWHYGEPFADHAAVPTYYVAAAARRHVTVALNGDGGDESFAGYPWNRAIRIAEWYHKLVPLPVRRGVFAPLAGALDRVTPRQGRARPLVRLWGDWSERSAADLFWVWPGFQRLDLDALCSPGLRSHLANCDPAGY